MTVWYDLGDGEGSMTLATDTQVTVDVSMKGDYITSADIYFTTDKGFHLVASLEISEDDIENIYATYEHTDNTHRFTMQDGDPEYTQYLFEWEDGDPVGKSLINNLKKAFDTPAYSKDLTEVFEYDR